jgi:ADP-heptose:LPS heptosyltransferase
MARPFYRALKKAYPHHSIHFLVSEALSTFDDSDFCVKKGVLNKEAKRVGRRFFELASQLASEKYEFAVSLSSSLSSSALLCAAQIPIRVGFSQGGSQIFWTDSLKWRGIKSGKHKSELYLELINFLTSKTWSLDLAAEAEPSHSSKLILVAPGASIGLRVWPHFKALVRDLSSQYPDYEIRWVGGKSEAHWHQEIQEEGLKNVIDGIEKTTLSQLIEWCRRSSLVIANDSGVAHLAGTVARVPTLVLFGPGDPNYIRPLGPKIIKQTPSDVPCHPCEKAYCHKKYGYQICLRQISLQEVLSSVRRVIPS